MADDYAPMTSEEALRIAMRVVLEAHAGHRHRESSLRLTETALTLETILGKGGCAHNGRPVFGAIDDRLVSVSDAAISEDPPGSANRS
ncbi:hypothetical protein [Microvirga massiliensis]|uniref:hypothetical protein n=1 Tax=Microvirga massiliensis TaxID=1033741 RepID=UPI00062B52B5|nr:hypothetical protein [Microvirga massiliensis]